MSIRFSRIYSVTPEGGSGSPHQYMEMTRGVKRLYVIVEGIAGVESAYISWARSLRSEVCRQSLSGGPGYL
jgi:hypothetical protein